MRARGSGQNFVPSGSRSFFSAKFWFYAHFCENLGQTSECNGLKIKNFCHNDRKSRRWR